VASRWDLTNDKATPREVVTLRYASLPPPLGIVAVHFWFTVADLRVGRFDRWEVWQTADAGGVSFGHLHCNLQSPEGHVGGGSTVLAATWRGDDARRLSEVLMLAKDEYPYRDHYRAWPGPNSNTFVAWVLDQARTAFQLPWKAHGRRYARSPAQPPPLFKAR